VDQARRFTQTLEQSYVAAISVLISSKPSGGVIVEDASKTSLKRNKGEGVRTLSASLSYDIADGDSRTPIVHASRSIHPEGGAPVIKERIHAEGSGGHVGAEDGKVEEELGRLSVHHESLVDAWRSGHQSFSL
jgi:hypothetical protein